MQCGLPPSDTHSIICTTIEMRLWDHLRNVAAGIDLLDVRCIGGMTPMMVVVQLRPRFDGQVRAALLAALSSPYLHPKIAVAVDEHVDAGDVGQIFRAIASATDPATDLQKVDRTRVFALDNASPIEAGMSAMYRVGTKVLIDATGATANMVASAGGADRDTVARQLGVEPATAVAELTNRLDTPVAPRTVAPATAPVNARKQTGGEVDLWRFTSGAGEHAGILVVGGAGSRLMGLIGWRADGAQRLTATSPLRLRLGLTVGTPVAVVVGTTPAAHLGAALVAASGQAGWAAAGALSETALDLVEGPDGVTVPAAADYVFFGRAAIDDAGIAVDVSEVWRHAAPAEVAPHAATAGFEALAVELTVAAHLRNVEGGIDVRDVRSYPETAHRLVTIKIRPRVEGQSKTALMAAVSSPDPRPCLAVAVDEDINAADLRDVAWSIASRLHAEDDVANLGGTGVHGGKWFFDSTMPPPTQPERRQAFERAIPKNLATLDLADFLPS